MKSLTIERVSFSSMARDHNPHPNYNVVTATGTPALRVMELVVKDQSLRESLKKFFPINAEIFFLPASAL